MTTAQLKAAFRDSRLWAQGITFQQACSQPVLLLAMQCQARAKARRAERQGKPAPQQPELFEEIAA